MDPLVLSADEIASLPWTPFGDWRGVDYKKLSEDGHRRYAGVMRMSRDAREIEHFHESSSHHLWVVDGWCLVAGNRLGPGSYVHVPPGIRHRIDEVGADGCTLFYVYECWG